MKTIKRIFLDDILGLVKNFFALVIVLGVCFLPALYAWFNIYSNWNPYGNTGALKIAAVSMDKGYTDEDGKYHNQGDTIMENLKENTSVNWQFVDSSEDAVNGVYSGKYYAAVVVDENFTYNMFNVLTEKVDRPTLHFYENQKKNPVATKISDTVVQTLQNNINVAFTEVVVSELFSNAEDVSNDIQEEGSVDKALEKLQSLSEDLTTYQNSLTEIIDNDAKLQESLEAAKVDAGNLKDQAYKSAKAVKDSASDAVKANTTINSYSEDVNKALDVINSKSADLTKILDELSSSNDAAVINSKLQEASVLICEIEKDIYALPNTIGEERLDFAKEHTLNRLNRTMSLILNFERIFKTDNQELKALISNLQKSVNEIDFSEENVSAKISEINSLEEAIKSMGLNGVTVDVNDDLRSALKEAKQEGANLESTLNSEVIPKISTGLSSLSGMLDNTNALLNNVGETFGNLEIMFDAIGSTIDNANTSLEKTNEAIVYVNGRLIELINDVEKAGESEKLKVLINALSGDPEMYGKFFSTPVEVVTEEVYPIENYGSAVAPFYSTLAFWVGALILTALIKVKPDKEKYSNASLRQLFFGRYVLFWILGQIQAVIIVIGDIYLLKIQCLHPGLFLLAGSIIATTFTLLIYSLVVTWGDAGKALAVVLVVIQIAGSSGTYPIELLPDFFKKMYIFFPFPYAINAIRECLCGLYKMDYVKYLGTLLIFIAVALFIGLLIRIPFEPINHYMEERMEDTEMM
ncbi:YhgE/Pip domain-containing protein [Pseudobutyrivibrio sp. MD2005]|uniref:YhgE/Pip domain-containing protein n=1 Tax=Pseudobutyrivibrio sp. MD2005 TaxID=1410616 RepID=UPI000484E04E|nr:YhgE/Pip domain-containing protein [Pseudobutyrivibrio sp. MD2005]